MSEQGARRRSIALLDQVGIPAAGSRFDLYPHEFSGGMRQRVMIAIALLCEPELADRRRADHRARRHRAGADPRAPAAAQARSRHGDRADHPRSRRGRRPVRPGHGDVCRADRRGGAGGCHVRGAAASLHAGPAAARRRAWRSRPRRCARSPASRPTCRPCRPAARSTIAARSPSSAASSERPRLRGFAPQRLKACHLERLP